MTIGSFIFSMLGAATVAKLSLHFWTSVPVLMNIEHARGLPVCFAIEFFFSFVHFMGVAIYHRVKHKVRGVMELKVFVTVAVILLGAPFSVGGPSLNMGASIIAAVNHGDWMLGCILCSAELMAACAAAWHVKRLGRSSSHHRSSGSSRKHGGHKGTSGRESRKKDQ
eukprot:GHVU01073839.1.p4 GENE.GHVU01073839.1~~GHVU01073839.1.p4  ORF type:complete len:167 (+),score=23.96 GHVU01073839.1:1111-1611(+)